MGLEVFDHYECDGQMEIENTVPVRKLTHLSLFSGIGGLDLAAEWAGFESMGQCEYADYPTKILAQHWPDVPRWRDIRTLTGESFYERTGLRTIDIISGGFPCQPFSVAGKQRGKEDDRYLWPEMVRVITELRPTWVIGENVAGIIHMALDTVLSDLEGQGYATRTFLIPACGVNAPHQRYRTAIVACAKGHNSGGLPIRKETENARFSSSEDVPNPHGAGCQKLHLSRITDTKRFTGGGINEGKVCNAAGQGLSNGPSKPMERYKTQKSEPKRSDSNVPNTDLWEPMRRETYAGICEKIGKRKNNLSREKPKYAGEEWWAVEPNVGRVAYGVPNRVDRIKSLGNAVVPQQFYPIFKAIAEIECGVEN